MIADRLLSALLALALLVIIDRRLHRIAVARSRFAVGLHAIAVALLLVSGASVLSEERGQIAFDLGRLLTMCCVFLWVGRVGGALSERRKAVASN